MIYDFDRVIDRRGTDSLKYDACGRIFGRDDLIPLWVADMDFPTAQPVIDAVVAKAQVGIFGYAERSGQYFETICAWQKRRNNWAADPKLCSYAVGVIPAITSLFQLITAPGDGVLIMPPVYSVFYEIIRTNDRTVVECPLTEDEDGRWQINFDLFEEKIKEAKLFLLCSPHNPLGIVWKREELERLERICRENGVRIISDEIHADLILSGRHIPTASISPEAAASVITCISATKTFNLAGLNASTVIFPDEEIKALYDAFWTKLEIGRNNTFSLVAMETAYREGEEWLEQLKDYLRANCRFAKDYLDANVPGITTYLPDATYLMWLDCRALGLSQKELVSLMVDKAGVALSSGTSYCPDLEGFMRLNIACPRSILEKGLEQIRKAVCG